MIVGGVIGSGIFRKPGVMAAQVGSPELLLLVWVLAGVLTLFGALTHAEIAAMLPETGGQYVYFEILYGPFFAFLYGWAMFIVVQTGSIAAIAYVCAEYAGEFIRFPDLTPALAAWSFHLPFLGDIAPLREFGTKLFATAVIVFLTTVSYLGVRFGGWVQNVSTIAKVSAMALLALGAFILPTGGHVQNLTSGSPTLHLHGFGLLAGMVAALQGAFWAYDGWNKITYIAGEIKEPQRNIPRALASGLLFVTAVYVLLNAAYAYVLPIQSMAGLRLVAADVAEKCFHGGARWISAAVVISTLGAANATILATARVYFSMARRQVFPAFIGRSHPRFHTPSAALLVQAVWSILLLFSGTFDMLTDTLIFVSWIFYAAGAYGVFILRRRQPEAPRPYLVPGYPVIPWIFILTALVYLAVTVGNDVQDYRAAVAAGKPALINSAFGTVLVLTGAPVYFWYRTRNSRKVS